MNWIKHGWSLLGNMHKITAQFYRYSKRVSELKSVSGSFSAQVRCSSRGPLAPSCVQFRRPVFERTPGSLLRPVQGTSLREDPWRPPASSSGDQSSRGPLAPSCVHTKLPFQDDVFAQGSPNSPHPQLHRFRFVWLHAIKK